MIAKFRSSLDEPFNILKSVCVTETAPSDIDHSEIGITMTDSSIISIDHSENGIKNSLIVSDDSHIEVKPLS